MDRRFELRKEAMLAECEVAPQVFAGALDRLAKFVEPFALLLTQQAQRQHALDYMSGLISDLNRHPAKGFSLQVASYGALHFRFESHQVDKI
jgi:hypothetical protein